MAGIVAESAEAHQAIASGIVRGDPVGTVEAAGAHLDQVEERMLPQLD